MSVALGTRLVSSFPVLHRCGHPLNKTVFITKNRQNPATIEELQLLILSSDKNSQLRAAKHINFRTPSYSTTVRNLTFLTSLLAQQVTWCSPYTSSGMRHLDGGDENGYSPTTVQRQTNDRPATVQRQTNDRPKRVQRQTKSITHTPDTLSARPWGSQSVRLPRSSGCPELIV